MKVELEFTDGASFIDHTVPSNEAAWEMVRLAEQAGLAVLSAWRDDEPWFGLCTDMREGTP